MIKIAVIISAFFLSSCIDEQAIYRDDETKTTLSNLHFKLDSIEPLIWEVGIDQKTNLTKAIRISLQYPLLKQEVIENLVKKFGIDSWLMRIRRIGGERAEDILGHIILPFSDRGWFTVDKNFLSLTLRINYDAVHFSNHLERYPCPLVDHTKYIESDFIEKKNSFEIISLIVLVRKLFESTYINLNDIKFQSPSFSGGNSLVGEYFFEFALYNSNTNELYSEFEEASHLSFFINEEENRTVLGCNNFNPENI